MLRDRDTKFTKEFDEIIKSQGIEIKMVPYKSPNLNPYAESWVSTVKRECLDYFVAFGKEHFEYLVREYVKYYDTVRPHSGIGDKALQEKSKFDGEIKSEAMLGGLIKRYYRDP